MNYIEEISIKRDAKNESYQLLKLLMILLLIFNNSHNSSKSVFKKDRFFYVKICYTKN